MNLFLVGDLDKYMLPCSTKKYLGFDCMGCGIQRSLALIYEGEFIAAFKMYPGIYGLLLLTIFIILNIFVKFKYSTKIITITAAITVATIIISYIIKITTH
ncbi:DUF2752 domain-containing protein [Spongiivirga citrea]|uniref:DUF2752 domain-containing protein n=1 Tax=Spongiivirga citrea TaxID=1481457 RepID=A0A6M0CK13_9FLAO|nr:DUF2752 domain-containing protein [Spongiivirga citrea]NER16324.1 DUF2752 domain-containing protein [Spongiivirga citrea]